MVYFIIFVIVVEAFAFTVNLKSRNKKGLFYNSIGVAVAIVIFSLGRIFNF